MIIAVIGGRDFHDYSFIKEYLDTQEITGIISGEQEGVDKCAKRYAFENNIYYKGYKAEWNKYGLSAGPIRNKLVIDDCERVIAFWNQSSIGTKNAILYANKTNKQVTIVRI